MRILSSAVCLATFWGTTAISGAPDASIRPSIRPFTQDNLIHLAAAAIDESPRPEDRPKVGAAKGETQVVQKDGSDFGTWLGEFRQRAEARGIVRDTLNRAFAGVTFDPDAIRRDRNQAEFTKPIWEYLNTAVSSARVSNGQAAMNQHRAVLDRIEAQYGVDKQVVVAIWGLESAYGSYRGNDSTIRSLATLAYDARRKEFFEEQLMQALHILQDSHVTPDRMKGSWAGAMGHTQFMPTSFQEHAVDFTGDGKRDIWSDDPSDALASTANYLRHFGWTKGQPWGVEVRLPSSFDFMLANRNVMKSPEEWAALGITDMDGRAVPDHGEASILLPAGGKGTAFMIFSNFDVIERYNTADAYVIGVGHLSDRIVGKPAIKGDWPRGDRALTFTERKELQQRLTSKGYDTQKIDGRIGPLTINAVRAYQVAEGIQPDGYASLRLLERLR